MKPRNLLILFLVVVALAAFIFFFERDLPSSEERAERAKRVLAVEADEIRAVVVRRGEETARLEREEAAEQQEEAAEERWRLMEPMTAAADAETVGSLVDVLAELTQERAIDDYDEAAMGLAEPRASVTVTAGERELTLDIGAAVPASSNMIVRRRDLPQAFVVADGLWNELDRAPGDWRSRDLFDLTRADIERVRLVRGEESVELARREDRFWLETPLNDLADEQRVEDLLGDLVALEAEEFLDQPKLSTAEMGLEPARQTVELAVAGREEPARLEIGEPAADGGRFARWGEQLVTIDDTLDEALERPATEWQSREWSTLDTWQVNAIEVKDAEGELRLVRDGSDWKRGEDRIDYELVSDLLYAVDGLIADRLLEPGPAVAVATVEIRLTGEDAEDRLALFGAIEGGYPATSGDRPYRLLLPSADVDDLLAKVGEVRFAERLADPVDEPAEVDPEDP